MKKLVYKIYKIFGKNRVMLNLFNFLYSVILPLLIKKNRPAKYRPKEIIFERKDSNKKFNLKDIKAAVICDDMTYQNIREIVNAYFITPSNYLKVMCEFKPDLLFCESCWSGISEYNDCWRGKIYRNERLFFENRRVLLNILDYCNKCSIKTVFWNKEDPFYFDDQCHNFSDTALKFDYIFTTAEECVKRYKKLGGKNVNVLGFGFSPKLFNSSDNELKENKAVFAGSYYADHAERCKDMEEIFDMVLEKGIKLEIYDRHFNSSNPINKFPDKYKPYIHEAVDYTKLGEILKTSRFAININTEKKSETMFARRVYELMACRCVIISNESKGMRKMFGKKIWFLGDDFDFSREKAFVEENYEYVMTNCTNEISIRNLMKSVGLY